jgi:adenosylcobyric acid synthase
MQIEGYEIHMGRTSKGWHTTKDTDGAGNTARDISGIGDFCVIKDHRTGTESTDGTACGNIYGTYVHGVFDAPGVARKIIEILAAQKGVPLQAAEGKRDENAAAETDLRTYKETQYDLLADTLRRHLDMKRIYEIIMESENRPADPAEGAFPD